MPQKPPSSWCSRKKLKRPCRFCCSSLVVQIQHHSFESAGDSDVCIGTLHVNVARRIYCWAERQSGQSRRRCLRSATRLVRDFTRLSASVGELWDEWNTPGSILAGRRTVEQIDHWGGDNHGVPIVVPSHRPPGPTDANYPLVTYVRDGIENAMAQAKAAAGNLNVLVLGAYTAQRALEAGVLDELQIHQIPVLFGSGRRLFEVLPSRIELEIVRVIDTPDATHIRYRVRR